MFGIEQITRRCLLTFSDGSKMQATITIPKPTKSIFPKEMEFQLVKQLNESQSNAVHKVVKCYIMRN